MPGKSRSLKRNSKRRVSKRGGAGVAGSAVAAPKAPVLAVADPTTASRVLAGADVPRPRAAAAQPNVNIEAAKAATDAHAKQENIGLTKAEVKQSLQKDQEVRDEMSIIKSTPVQENVAMVMSREADCIASCGNDKDCYNNRHTCYSSPCEGGPGTTCKPRGFGGEILNYAGRTVAEAEGFGLDVPFPAVASQDLPMLGKSNTENIPKQTPPPELSQSVATTTPPASVVAVQPVAPANSPQIGKVSDPKSGKGGDVKKSQEYKQVEVEEELRRQEAEQARVKGPAEQGQFAMAEKAGTTLMEARDKIRSQETVVGDAGTAVSTAKEARKDSLSKKNLGNIILIRDDKEVDVYGGAQIVQTDEKNAVLIVNTTGLQEGGGLMDSLKNFGQKIKGAVSSKICCVISRKICFIENTWKKNQFQC
jgi:hypothetical protein